MNKTPCPLTIQLWLGRQNVEQMVAGFRAIEPYLDIAILGTHSNQAGVLKVLKILRGAGGAPTEAPPRAKRR